MMKYTLMAPKWTSEWGQQRSSTAISRMVRQPAANCPKKLPDNSIIFTAEATAISLALNYYQHIGQVHHNVVVYSDSMSCLQAIEGEDTENPFICHIMSLLRLLSDKGTHVRFCSIPSHCDIEWKWKSRPTSKGDPRSRYRPTGKYPLYRYEATGQLLHSEMRSNQVGCSCTWQRSLYREANIRAKSTKSHILSLWPLTVCHHCGQTLTICSWSVQCYRNVVMNTTQLTHWKLSSRQFLRLA